MCLTLLAYPVLIYVHEAFSPSASMMECCWTQFSETLVHITTVISQTQQFRPVQRIAFYNSPTYLFVRTGFLPTSGCLNENGPIGSYTSMFVSPLLDL